MTIRLHSENPDAFRHLTEALEEIDDYFARGRQIQSIENAGNLLDRALSEDADYGLAVFYKGMALDLEGKPADAVDYFGRIQEECESEKLRIESAFNLGVAYYHQYSHPNLGKAKEKFSEVIESEIASAGLKDLALAHLAQTHAMLMRPTYQERQNLSPGILNRIKNDYDTCIKMEVDYISNDPNHVSKNDRVRAIFSNAVGMANMYLTDYVATTPKEREEYLSKARKSLEKASDLSLANDWANTCDLGSVHLRTGILHREQGKDYDASFHAAEEKLLRVVGELRPNYGFALYELGILNRVWQRFDKARDYQEKALMIPVQYRDIADKSVQKEIDRSKSGDFEYP